MFKTTPTIKTCKCKKLLNINIKLLNFNIKLLNFNIKLLNINIKLLNINIKLLNVNIKLLNFKPNKDCNRVSMRLELFSPVICDNYS